MKLKQQKEEYLDTKLTDVFHFLSLNSSHSFLIGSSNLRNIKYAVDYDLNQNLKIKDTVKILNKVYHEFLSIFQKAYDDENYFIVDFKCGYINDEPIRWNFEQLRNGHQYIEKKMITFDQCLIMPDNIIKLDLVYVYNGIFTDINILYQFHIVGRKENLQIEKNSNDNDMIESLNEDIEELIKEHRYFKALKRMFALSNIEKKPNEKLLQLFNSDLGMLYKLINSLQLYCIMLAQTFKPVSENLLKSNLEFIKQTGSFIMIDGVNIDNILDKMVSILNAKAFNKSKVEKQINELINKLEIILNKKVKEFI